MYMELEVQCTCMYDPKIADFIFQKIAQLLPLAMYWN